MNALTQEDFERAAAALGCDVATVRAVAEVEAAGKGFLVNGRPQILFEAHIFHRLTKGVHADKKDRNGVALSSAKWDRTLYGKAGTAQHDRLEDAAAHDLGAALKACSWGLFQILGSNHIAAGYPSLGEFVEAMHSGVGAHLDAFVSFVQSMGLDEALRRHDWAAFARGYNGPAYATNQYDTKLENAWKKWSSV
jgi:hypothetical protein